MGAEVHGADAASTSWTQLSLVRTAALPGRGHAPPDVSLVRLNIPVALPESCRTVTVHLDRTGQEPEPPASKDDQRELQRERGFCRFGSRCGVCDICLAEGGKDSCTCPAIGCQM